MVISKVCIYYILIKNYLSQKEIYNLCFMYLLYIKIMKLKTFIKWSGNKSKHLRHLIQYVPKDFNTYIDPFVGSGATVAG